MLRYGMPVIVNDRSEIPNSEFVHAVGVVDGARNTSHFYLNGKRIHEGQDPPAATVANGDRGLYIGTNPYLELPPTVGTTDWAGAIDELKVWDRALRSEEVAMLYAEGASTSVDRDGDGQSDAHEEIAGTDPVDPSSVFWVRLQKGDGPWRLAWERVNGRRYVVERSGSLEGGSWEIAGETVEGVYEVEAGIESKRFYRVRVMIK